MKKSNSSTMIAFTLSRETLRFQTEVNNPYNVHTIICPGYISF